MSTAALIASWGKSQRRGAFALPANIPGPMNPAGQPADGGTGGAIGLTVELYLGALGWTDISPYVLYRDSSVLVHISRGRPNETTAVQPQTATFQVNNRDGRFSPRNPAGPYYSFIGRNTQVRISRLQNGVRRYRFVGEVTSWPTTWEISGTDVWVDVPAAGQLRRLQQGAQNLGSAMYRAYTLQESGALNTVAYWPCEEGATATSFASGIKGNAPMTFSGSPTLASNTAFLCSLPLPVTNASQWLGTVPTHPADTDNVLRFLMQVPSGGDADGAVIASMSTLGTVKRADLIYRSGGALQFKGYDATNTALFDTGAVVFTVNGAALRVSAGLRTSGSDVQYEIGTLAPGAGAALVSGGTLTGASIGNTTQIAINPGGVLTGTAIGHVSYQSLNDTLFDLANQLNAWNGESPGNRYARLCQEQGVNVGNFFPTNTLGGNGVTMGYQRSDTLANLVQQIADTDLSPVWEATDQLALVRRTRVSLLDQGTSYNTRRGLTLDFARHQLSGPLDPLDDDATTRNDVTVSRISGSFAQATLAAGALSTQSAPNGVGDYPTTYSLSVGADAALADHAHWRLHMGTVDEPRYPKISLNLRHPQFTGNTDLMNQALTLEIGDLVVIDNPPSWMAPDPIRLILLGYSEALGVFEHDMDLNCAPEAPYRVGIVGDAVLGAADTDGSTLAAAMGPVLNPNPFFAGASSAGWAGTNCALSVPGTAGAANPLPAGGPAGYGLLLNPTGAGSPTAAENASSAAVFPGVGGATYYVSALVYYPSAALQVTLGLGWQDANFNPVSSSSASFTVAAGVWTAISASFPAFATAAYGYPTVGLAGTPAVGDLLYAASVVAWSGGMSVASTNALLPLWTTSAGAFPFDIAVSPQGTGGERMTVIAIAGGASPQTFTVARGVNGVAAALPAGRDVRLWQPCVVSL